jgi:hypothetical protein
MLGEACASEVMEAGFIVRNRPAETGERGGEQLEARKVIAHLVEHVPQLIQQSQLRFLCHAGPRALLPRLLAGKDRGATMVPAFGAFKWP